MCANERKIFLTDMYITLSRVQKNIESKLDCLAENGNSQEFAEDLLYLIEVSAKLLQKSNK